MYNAYVDPNTSTQMMHNTPSQALAWDQDSAVFEPTPFTYPRTNLMSQPMSCSTPVCPTTDPRLYPPPSDPYYLLSNSPVSMDEFVPNTNSSRTIANLLKREVRKQKNRLSAARSRSRNRERTKQLEKMVLDLQTKNRELELEIERLKKLTTNGVNEVVVENPITPVVL